MTIVGGKGKKNKLGDILSMLKHIKGYVFLFSLHFLTNYYSIKICYLRCLPKQIIFLVNIKNYILCLNVYNIWLYIIIITLVVCFKLLILDFLLVQIYLRKSLISPYSLFMIKLKNYHPHCELCSKYWRI